MSSFPYPPCMQLADDPVFIHVATDPHTGREYIARYFV